MLGSIPDVCSFVRVGDARAPLRLVIEVPHGATRTKQFTELAERLTSPLPKDLVDFFHVNTDAGAPELASSVAEAIVARHPDVSVVVVASEIPRTFIDCNRVLDVSREAYREGKVTPGIPPWITSEEDHRLLRGLHARYTEAVEGIVRVVCGDRGRALLLHTYAPRSVDVEVDLDIVASMHRAYAPDQVEIWPLRPSLDLIGRTQDGLAFVDPILERAIVAEFQKDGLGVGLSATYPLHPSTIAWAHVKAWPGRVLCLEVRRDLLAAPFEPFAQMAIGPVKVDRIASTLAGVLGPWITSRA